MGFDQVSPLGELTIRWTGAEDGEVEITDEFDTVSDPGPDQGSDPGATPGSDPLPDPGPTDDASEDQNHDPER